jgi:hypothetical protein
MRVPRRVAILAAVSVIVAMSAVGVTAAGATSRPSPACAAGPSAAAVSRTVAEIRRATYHSDSTASRGSAPRFGRLVKAGAARLDARVRSTLRAKYCLTLVSRAARRPASARTPATSKPDLRHPSDNSDGSENDITWDRPEIFYDSENANWYAVGDWEFSEKIMDALLNECGNPCGYSPDTGYPIGADDVMGLAFNFKLQQNQGAVTYCGDGSYYGCSTHTTAGNGVIKPSGVYFAEQDRFTINGNSKGFDYLTDNGTITDEFKTTNDQKCHGLQAYPNYAHDWSSTSINSISIGTDSIGISWSSQNYRWMTQTNPTSPAVKVC